MTRVPVGLALATAGAVASAVLAVLVTAHVHALAHADTLAVTTAVAGVHAHRWLLHAARAVTWAGAPVVVDVVAVGSAVALLMTGRRRAAAVVATTRLVTLVLSPTVKVLVDRPRPHVAVPVAHASGASFPSGHSLGAASLWLSLALVTAPASRRAASGVAVVVALAVGASRVLLGVHYPSDAAAGLLLGWAVALAVTAAAHRPRRTDRISASSRRTSGCPPPTATPP